MNNRLITSGLSALAVLLLLTACTSGPIAQVSASATKVTLASKSGHPAEVKEKSEAHPGDVVQTDSDGRAQLDYPDGSLTRLGPDTKLTVDVLDSATAQRTALTLDVGQSWHRVEKLVAEKAQYEVSTPVGVAAVKGTAFEVDCTPAKVCTVTVVEGVVEFTATDGTVFEIKPYQRLVVPNPGGGDPVVAVAPADVVQADEWISGNLSADKITQEVPAAAQSVAGDWDVTFTFTSTSGLLATTDGSTSLAVWTIGEPQCADVCSFSIVSSTGTTYTGTLTETGISAVSNLRSTTCTDLDTGEVSDAGYDYTVEVDLTRPGSAGAPASFDGKALWHYVHKDYAGACTYQPTDFEEAADIAIVRQ